LEAESGLGDEAVDETGSVLDALESGLDQLGEVVDAMGGEVTQTVFEICPHAFAEIELGSVGG
jgi:hypothetical protein